MSKTGKNDYAKYWWLVVVKLQNNQMKLILTNESNESWVVVIPDCLTNKTCLYTVKYF